jgi:hypothetical protein
MEFAQHAIARDDGTALSSADRELLGLTNPSHPLAMPQGQLKKVNGNRIRAAMAELAAMNVENAHAWLAQLAADSPKAALEMFIELAKFSAPQLKAVAIDVRDQGTGDLKRLSVADLEKIVSDQ